MSSILLPRSASAPVHGAAGQVRLRFPLRALGLSWLSWLLVVLILGLMNSPSGAPTVAAELLVLLHAVVAVAIFARQLDRTTASIIGLSLLLRTALVFWDVNFSHILMLPNGGSDTESYYYWAVQVSQDPSLTFEDLRGEVYSKVVGLLFWLVGPLRVVGQYTNALLGVSAVLLMADLLERLPMADTQRIRVLAVIALLPNAVVLSAIFLRESLISFLIAVSVYYFVRWFQGGSALNVLGVAGAVMAASTLHAGVIAVGVGYMIVITFYRRKAARFGLPPQSVMYIAFFAAIIYFVLAQYPDLFLGKFEAFDTEDDVLRATSYRGGGSQYLSGLTVTSYADMLQVGPLRAFYFLASPMPWDFRGVVDLLAFAFDSLFYIGVPILFLVRRRQIDPRWRMLGYALLIILAVSSLLFGAGVSNAGTAARHRFKLVSVVMGVLIVARTATKRYAGSKVSGSRRAVNVADTANLSDERATSVPASGRRNPRARLQRSG